MKVSVIVPVYNGDKHLNACLDSLVNQTLKEIEIVCVDDGSTDNSGKILDTYLALYPNKFHVFHIENGGVYKAREYGITQAVGEYIGFCDCDDVVEADMYHILYEKAVYEDAELAVCAYQRVDENTEKILCTEMNQFGNDSILVSEHKDVLPVINTALWNKVIRRDVALKHVKFEKAPRIAEDMMFLMSIYPYMNRIAFCNKALYHYYVRKGSAMSSVKQEEIKLLKETMLDTKEQVEQCGKNEWEQVLKLVAFIHFGIAFVLKSAGVNATAVQMDISHWLDCEFSNWKQNPYLKLRYVIKGHRYLAKPMIVMWVYKLGMFPLFLKMYVWLTQKMNFDVKW